MTRYIIYYSHEDDDGSGKWQIHNADKQTWFAGWLNSRQAAMKALAKNASTPTTGGTGSVGSDTVEIQKKQGGIWQTRKVQNLPGYSEPSGSPSSLGHEPGYGEFGGFQ